MTTAEGIVEEAPPDDAGAFDPTPTSTPHGRRLPSALTLLLVALLVVVAAQVVITAFLLHSTNQLRDQTASAAGLQRCEASAVITAANDTQYHSLVQSCLNR